MHTKT